MDKYCYTVTFGVDQFTGEVLTQAEDILSQKFFLSMVYGGDFKPPLIQARDGQLLYFPKIDRQFRDFAGGGGT